MLAVVVVAPARAQLPRIDTLALRAHTAFLADDQLLGRATGTPGADVAALYIASQCRRLGLLPLGQEYGQPVPLVEARPGPDTRLVLARGTTHAEFTIPDDILLNVGTRGAFQGFNGRAVFLGAADELAGSPSVALVDRVAVTLGVPEPGMLDSLAHHGAVAFVHLVGEEAFQLYARSRGSVRLFHADEIPSSFLPGRPSVIGGPRVARALLQGSIVGPDGAPLPQALALSVHLELVADARPVTGVNVACRLPGLARPDDDSAIVFTAHYDHLGVGLPDAFGDSVYNGFSDNAAGVAMLLAIAEARIHDPPRCSWLFLFLTGEEGGLLGSDYYVAHPPWPLERTRAVINLDAGAPPSPPVRWRLAAVEGSRAAQAAAHVAATQGWSVTTSPARPNSDHYPFVRLGVPTVFIIPGAGPYEGLTADSSNALRRRWDRYHQPGDEWAEDFPWAGLARYAVYAYLVALALDTR